MLLIQEIKTPLFCGLLLLGEATKRLSKDLRDCNLKISWKEMAALRDVVVHKYDDINLDIIQGVVELELPKIVPMLKELMNREFQ